MAAAGLTNWLSSVAKVNPEPFESLRTVLRACQFGTPPDLLVILDDLNPLVLIGEVRRLPTSPRLLVIMSDSPTTWDEVNLLRAGAHGVLLGSARRNEVQAAVLCILNGHVVASPPAVQALSMRRGEDDSGLTARQSQIMGLLREGSTTSAMAEALGISPATVATHIRRLATRYNADGKRDLERIARRSAREPTDSAPVRPPVAAFMTPE